MKRRFVSTISLLVPLALSASAGAHTGSSQHPAHTEVRDPKPVEALKAHGAAIWREWSALRRAGLLANDLVFLCPPMRPEGTNSAFSEQVVDWLREGAPATAKVVYGEPLKNLLNGGFYSEQQLVDSSSAVDLARRLQAGFVVTGEVREATNEAHQKSITVRVVAQRTDELTPDVDSGAVRFDRMNWKDEFLQAQSKHGQPASVPFGGSRGAQPIILDDSKRAELLRRALASAAETLIARCRDAKASGDVGVGPGDRKLLVLPARDDSGALNALSDTLTRALSGASGFSGSIALKSVVERAATANVTSAWLFEPQIDPSVLEKLGLSGVVQPRFFYDSLLGQLVIEAQVVDDHGRSAAIEPTPIFTADFSAALESVLERDAATKLPAATGLDGTTLLRDALEGLVRQALSSDELLRGKRLRLMPLETDATAEVGALFAAVFNDLIGEKRRVLEVAAKLGLTEAQALEKGGGELRVRIAVLGGQEFESYDLARRTLVYWSWANVERAPAFELGRKLNDSLAPVAAELGFDVQLTNEALAPLEKLTSDLRSPDPRVTSFNLAEPELVLQLRISKLGDSLELRGALLDATQYGEVKPLRRVQTRLRGDIADAIAKELVKQVKPVPPERLLFTVPGRLASATAAAAAPKALAGATIELRATGRKGEELARRLEATLGESVRASTRVAEASASTVSSTSSRAETDASRLRICAGAGAETAASELLAFIAQSNDVPAELRGRLRALSPSLGSLELSKDVPAGVVVVVIDG